MICVLMAQLAPVYYRADFGAAQAEALFGAFVEDLSEFAIVDIEDAIRAYRRDAKNKYYPTPAQLRDLSMAAYRNRVDRAKPKVKLAVEHRPILWWLMPFWQEHWQDEDIPADEYPKFLRHIERVGRPQIYKPEPILRATA